MASASSSRLKRKVSKRFCSPDADITLRSSDGALFKFYKKHLEVHTMAFAGAEGYALLAKDVVDLEEKSDVLEILLQFMSRQKAPTIILLDFAVLNRLAEAVAKYEVFSAMEASESAMSHPFEVLEYAVKHKKVDIMDDAATSSVGCRPDEARMHLSLGTFATWTLYSQHWLDVLNHAHKHAYFPHHCLGTTQECRCEVWLETVLQIVRHLGTRVESLLDLDDIKVVRATSVNKGNHCIPAIKEGIRQWKVSVHMKVAKIPKFSSLMKL